MQKMSISEEEWNFLMDHIGDACAESDSAIKMVYGEYCNVDKAVESMEDSQFIEMTIEVFMKIFKKYKKKLKKDQEQKESTEQEPDEAVEEDSEEVKEEEEIANE